MALKGCRMVKHSKMKESKDAGLHTRVNQPMDSRGLFTNDTDVQVTSILAARDVLYPRLYLKVRPLLSIAGL